MQLVPGSRARRAASGRWSARAAIARRPRPITTPALRSPRSRRRSTMLAEVLTSSSTTGVEETHALLLGSQEVQAKSRPRSLDLTSSRSPSSSSMILRQKWARPRPCLRRCSMLVASGWKRRRPQMMDAIAATVIAHVDEDAAILAADRGARRSHGPRRPGCCSRRDWREPVEDMSRSASAV